MVQEMEINYQRNVMNRVLFFQNKMKKLKNIKGS